MRLQCDYVGYPKISQETKDELQFVRDIVVRKNTVFCLLGLNQEMVLDMLLFRLLQKVMKILYI